MKQGGKVRPVYLCIGAGLFAMVLFGFRMLFRHAPTEWSGPPLAELRAVSEPMRGFPVAPTTALPGMVEVEETRIEGLKAVAVPFSSLPEQGWGGTRGFHLPPEGWENVGTASPAAAIETYLWAVHGGKLAELAEMVSVIRPEMYLQSITSLSPEALLQYGKPETAAALMSASREGRFVAVESADIKETKSGEITSVSVVLLHEDGSKWTKLFFLMPKESGWRIGVFGSDMAGFVKGRPQGNTPSLYRTRERSK